jgi:hypothetical protein
MKKDHQKLAAAVVVILVCLALVGCGESRAPYAGTYQSVEAIGGNHISLDLKEDGKGTWTLAGKSVEFTWLVNDRKIWVYTKQGAIVIVTPSEGGKILSADMTGDWHPGCPPGSCVNFKRVQEGG